MSQDTLVWSGCQDFFVDKIKFRRKKEGPRALIRGGGKREDQGCVPTQRRVGEIDACRFGQDAWAYVSGAGRRDQVRPQCPMDETWTELRQTHTTHLAKRCGRGSELLR